MDQLSDIANLFKHFDGDPTGYQEFVLSSDALHARSRWPLIAAIDPTATAQPASVIRERQGSMFSQNIESMIQTQFSAAAVHAAIEKPATRAQFVAPQAKVLSARSVRRGREPAALDRDSESAARPASPSDLPVEASVAVTREPAITSTPLAQKPKKLKASVAPRGRKSSVLDTNVDDGARAATQSQPVAKASGTAVAKRAPATRSMASKPKNGSASPKRRSRKPAELDTDPGDSARSSQQPGLTAETAGTAAEQPANEARFVAPKPKVLSAGPTGRGHKPAVFDTDAGDSARVASPVQADPFVAIDQNRHPAGNVASRPHSTDTPPFLFKRL